MVHWELDILVYWQFVFIMCWNSFKRREFKSIIDLKLFVVLEIQIQSTSGKYS